MEKSEAKNKMEEYMALFSDLRQRTGDSHVALGILQEVAKDIRIAQMREERGFGNGSSASTVLEEQPILATEAQIKLLRRLGAEIPEKLTKLRASELIDEMKLQQTAKASQ